MPTPSMLRIGVVTCIATNDLTGNDDLAGRLGKDRFFIGQFNAGDSVDVGVEASIAPGVTELTIVEEDLSGDDPLITIDLTQDMDVERVVGVLTANARYNINFIVVGTSD